MFKIWKIIVVFLIAIIIFSGTTLTGQHNNKLNIFLNNIEPVNVSSFTFLESDNFDSTMYNNTWKINHYSLSVNAKENIKDMTITVIGLDKNNNPLTVVDSYPYYLSPVNYIIHSNETLSKGKSKNIEVIYASINSQSSIGSLQFYVYDESNRLNNLISVYNVPVTINKKSRY
jgi:hypothetical protein